MTLLINNDEVKKVLTMEITMQALEEAYLQLIKGEAVCRPRIDIQIPTGDLHKTYQWGTMEGGSTSGYFAIRMKSDIVYEQEYLGTRTQEKYCLQPGNFCGLIFLFNIHNGEPLALINDGYLQHMRVGADSGIGVKYMAREDSKAVGMLGSGGMARSQVASFSLVRKITKIKVYSPTKANRETYAREIEELYGIETTPFDNPREVHKGIDILAGSTDASVPVIIGKWLEEGTHITCVGGKPDREAFSRIDSYLKLGTAPAPVDLPQFNVTDGSLAYAAIPKEASKSNTLKGVRTREREDILIAEDRRVSLQEILNGTKKGRKSPQDITYSKRGNIQGAQFFSVAGKVYELAKERGLGREIPTKWFLQDIRD
ncbi:MAG: ornithine cyclodeaminase family protein [Pseudomonadota bacterium]